MGAGMTWVCCVTGAQAASYPAPITSCREGGNLTVYVRRPSVGILPHNRGDGPVFFGTRSYGRTALNASSSSSLVANASNFAATLPSESMTNVQGSVGNPHSVIARTIRALEKSG